MPALREPQRAAFGCEEHARASTGGRHWEPFEAPFLRQGKQGKQAPALHMRLDRGEQVAKHAREHENNVRGGRSA